MLVVLSHRRRHIVYPVASVVVLTATELRQERRPTGNRDPTRPRTERRPEADFGAHQVTEHRNACADVLRSAQTAWNIGNLQNP